jgi:hypothetical protein
MPCGIIIGDFPQRGRGVGRHEARASAHMFSLYYKSMFLATFKDFLFSSVKIKKQKNQKAEKSPLFI